jgi:hypothetical protein
VSGHARGRRHYLTSHPPPELVREHFSALTGLSEVSLDSRHAAELSLATAEARIDRIRSEISGQLDPAYWEEQIAREVALFDEVCHIFGDDPNTVRAAAELFTKVISALHAERRKKSRTLSRYLREAHGERAKAVAACENKIFRKEIYRNLR